MSEVKIDPIEVVINDSGDKGKWIGLESVGGDIFAVVETANGSSRLLLADLRERNEKLISLIQSARQRVEVMGREGLIQPGHSVLRLDQQGSLFENVHTNVVRTGEGELGKVAMTTSIGGYVYSSRKKSNEDGALAAATSSDCVLVVADAVGSEEDGQVCTEKLLTHIAESPVDLLRGIQSAREAFPKNEGSVCFLATRIKKNHPLEALRVGDCDIRHYAKDGTLKYSSFSVRNIDEYDEAGDFAGKNPPTPQSIIEELEFGADKLRGQYISDLRLFLCEKDISLNDKEINDLLDKLYGADQTQKSEMRAELILAEKKARLNLEDALPRVVSWYKTGDYAPGYNQMIGRIILGKKPVVSRGPYFFRQISRIVNNALTYEDRHMRVDIRRAEVVEEGDWIMLYSDGVGDNLLPVSDDQDELDQWFLQALKDGSTPEALTLHIAQVIDERMKRAAEKDEDAREKVFKPDNATLIILQVI